MDFGPYGAFPWSNVPEMVDQQNSWIVLVISTYLLYLEWNVSMLVVNICILWLPTVQQFDIEDEQVLQRGEQRAWEVHVVKGEIELVPPAWRVGGLLSAE
jgi:hypothetical protein